MMFKAWLHVQRPQQVPLTFLAIMPVVRLSAVGVVVIAQRGQKQSITFCILLFQNTLFDLK